MNHINIKAMVAAAALASAMHPTHFEPHQPPSPKPKPFSDNEHFKELHIAELKAALSEITFRMANVRAKKHWQRAELDTLKHHRKLLSSCLSSLENATSVTGEQLLQADELLDAYRNA